MSDNELEKLEKRIQEYIIVRKDGVIVHTVPIPYMSALSIYEENYHCTYVTTIDKYSKIAYLSQFGNAEYFQEIDNILNSFPIRVNGIFENRSSFIKELKKHRRNKYERNKYDEFINKVKEFLNQPVTTKKWEPNISREIPAVEYKHFERYGIQNGYLVYSDTYGRKCYHTDPFSYEFDFIGSPDIGAKGISVYRDGIWIWSQVFMFHEYSIRYVYIRRNATVDEMLAELTNFDKHDIELMKDLVDWADANVSKLNLKEKELVESLVKQLVLAVKLS